MAKACLSRRNFLRQAPIAGVAAALPISVHAAPASVSPEMYAAIEAHRAADVAFVATIDASDEIYQRNLGKTVTQEALDEWDYTGDVEREMLIELCALKPRYPGDNAAKAKYLARPGKIELQAEHIDAVLASLM